MNHELTDAAMTMMARTKDLLEWMPVCSVGSSGYLNRVSVENAMKKLAQAVALNS